MVQSSTISKYECDSKRISFIEDNLYLGTVFAANAPDIQDELGLTDILSVGAPVDEKKKKDEIKYKFFEIEDKEDADLLSILDEAVEYIEQVVQKNGGRILVHCFSGMSRSGSVVVAYLMKRHKMSAERAIAFAKNRRSKVNPNDGFRQQLLEYEEKLKQEGKI